MNTSSVLLLVFILALLVILDNRNTQDDSGYVVVKKLVDIDSVNYLLKLWESKEYTKIKDFFMKNKKISLPEDYVLLDYCYLIEDTCIHTYHRDYTSSRKYNNLEYPSYTMILYLDNSDTGLTVVPGSHKEDIGVYLRDKSEKINTEQGDAVIFDADLLHSGSIPKSNKINRKCIQFKIIHKNDVDKMPWLSKFFVLINKPNNKGYFLKNLENSITLHLPIILDNMQGTIKTAFSEKKSYIQKYMSSLIFSNQDFYKPIRFE